MRPVAFLTVTLLLALAPLSLAGTVSGAPSCSGGNTDASAMHVTDGYHFSPADHSVYRDTNNLTGIQRTTTTCSEFVDGKWIHWTIAADEKIAGAPGVPSVPTVPLPGGCQLRPPHIWCPL